MAKGRIEQEIFIKIIGGKDVGELQKAIKQLERTKAELTVTADTDDARKELDEIDKQLAELRGEKAEIEVTAKVDRALDALDEVAAEAKKAEAAAEALSIALGPQLSAKADLDGIVSDFQRMGLSLEDITANADKLGAKLQEVGTKDVGGGLTTGFQRIDSSARSAGGSASVLANSIGNTAQDMGQLAGISGTAGVALGQMGEYMADASLSGEKLTSVLRNFSTVAAPVAILAAAFATFKGLQETFSDSTERTAENVDAMTEAIIDGKAPIQAYREQLAKLGEVTLDNVEQHSKLDNAVNDLADSWWKVSPAMKVANDLLGINFDKTEDILPVLKKAGIQVDQWSRHVEKGADSNAEFERRLRQTNLTADERDQIMQTLVQHQEQYVTSTENAAKWTGFWGDEVVDATVALEAQRVAMEIHTRIMDEFNTGYETARARAKEFADAYTQANLIMSQGPSLESAVSGASALFDELFGLRRIARSNESAFDQLGKTLEENGTNFDEATEKGRENQEVVEQLAQSLIPQLAASYKDAGGSFEAFAGSMEALRMTTFAQLREETGLTDAEIQKVMDRMGLFDGSTYQASFDLLGLEDAESKLAMLLPLLDDLQLAPDIRKEIALEVLAGDPAAALQTIQENIDDADPRMVPSALGVPANMDKTLRDTQAYLNGKPVNMYASLKGPVAFDAGGTVPAAGGIAGERGPEIINRRYLTTGPTYVPPGTEVTSRRRTAVILRSRGHRGLHRYDSGGTVPVTNVKVNVNLPAGADGADVVRQVKRWARRNGSLV